MLTKSDTSYHAHRRAVQAFVDVLPRGADVRGPRGAGADLIVGDQAFEVEWVGEGSLGRVRSLLASVERLPDVVVARVLSRGARELLADAGVGWVDETGAAEIARGPIIVSKTGKATTTSALPQRWTPSTLAVSEALLCGITPTVAATQAATGLSIGSCTKALKLLTNQGLLGANAPRGRASARQLTDDDKLLEVYAIEAAAKAPALSLTVGAVWQDPISGLAASGKRWSDAGIDWATTGTVAASVMAPLLTNVNAVDVYVDTKTLVGLEAVAAEAELRPIQGGRVTLRPFPTTTARQLATTVDELRVAPWPRVFVDLQGIGVRGEEAAEHLREVMRGN